MAKTPSVLITGASTGIGATYADRFARRGHSLVLVARDKQRMEALATQLHDQTGVAIDILQADLTHPAELAEVETRLREDRRIGILVNNAGASLGKTFVEQATDDVARLVALNVTAVARLASAVAPWFAEAREGAIINISSVVGLVPEFGWSVGELVDAALAGFDRREPVTIPPLHDAGQWAAYQSARQAMLPGFAQVHAAERYRTTD